MRVLIAALFTSAALAQGSMDPRMAKQAFDEAHQICSADNGQLWGHSLCGPMLFVDPVSHAAVGNQADKQGALKAADGVFSGSLPVSENIANTAVTWNGVLWSEVAWALPEDRTERDVLLMHESFHRLQAELQVPMKSPVNGHLDTLMGRYLFRLELRALAAALRSNGRPQHDAISDALTFRSAREKDFPGSRDSEEALETNEGLAEYTGTKLGGGDPQRALASGDHRPSFVRSSAYITGPALGYLLDGLLPGWHARALAGQPMDRLLAGAIGYQVPANLDVAVAGAAERYNGAEIMVAETTRDRENQRRQREFRAALVQGPVLRISLEKMNISFDPNKLYPLGDLGTVYAELRVSDSWGVLEVADGMALVGKNWDAVTVPAPSRTEGHDLSGPGWTLHLNDGYDVFPGPRPGDLRVGKGSAR